MYPCDLCDWQKTWEVFCDEVDHGIMSCINSDFCDWVKLWGIYRERSWYDKCICSAQIDCPQNNTYFLWNVIKMWLGWLDNKEGGLQWWGLRYNHKCISMALLDCTLSLTFWKKIIDFWLWLSCLDDVERGLGWERYMQLRQVVSICTEWLLFKHVSIFFQNIYPVVTGMTCHKWGGLWWEGLPYHNTSAICVHRRSERMYTVTALKACQ